MYNIYFGTFALNVTCVCVSVRFETIVNLYCERYSFKKTIKCF